MQELILLPEEESIGERADKYLAVQLPQYSRSFFQKLFKDDQIQIQNTPIKASYRITGEEEIALTIPDAQKPDIVPENIPLDILYEDQDLLVVNKPKGMVVHPAHGHYSGTLVNALCIIVRTVFPESMGYCVPVLCIELIWIPQAL